jgi:hypothetical protein
MATREHEAQALTLYHHWYRGLEPLFKTKSAKTEIKLYLLDLLYQTLASRE